MRIESWRAKEVFQGIFEEAEQKVNTFMDSIATSSQMRLNADVTKKPPIIRQGKFASAKVNFVAKSGKNKDRLVSFTTNKRWTGRRSLSTKPYDQLHNSIRRVNKEGSGTVRVYVGSYLAYWAFMVEKTGYHDRGGKFHPPMHFLQNTFDSQKANLISTLAKG
jgi:hypothetical protein